MAEEFYRRIMETTGITHSIRSHHSLIWQLAKRDVIGRYRGSFLGILWSLITPLVMLAIYGFVFSVVFKARWGETTGAKGEFAIILFAGLILHGLLAECLTRAPNIITGNPNFVKKIVFPLEVLIPASLLSAFMHFLIGFCVFFVGSIVVFQTIHITLLWTPVILLPFILFIAGVMWIFAALGVYFRDLTQIMGLLMTILLFASPILFPSSMLPEAVRPLIYLNPLSFIVEQLRDVVLWGKAPYWPGLIAYTVIGITSYITGFYIFQKLRRGFADVL